MLLCSAVLLCVLPCSCVFSLFVQPCSRVLFVFGRAPVCVLPCSCVLCRALARSAVLCVLGCRDPAHVRTMSQAKDSV
eukprot:8177187-Pyramimonas_sp.AAC.1